MLVRFVLNLLQETIIYMYFLIFNIQVETKQGNAKCSNVSKNLNFDHSAILSMNREEETNGFKPKDSPPVHALLGRGEIRGSIR